MNARQPQPQPQIHPDIALTGNCGYEIQNDRVIINIEQIANNRNGVDISGTLAVELWALKQPYSGIETNGTVLASTSIGELLDQHFLADCRYDLIFDEPPVGTWYLSVVLREWTGTGYVTRDHMDFSHPYVVASRPTIVRSDTDNVINVNFAENKNPASQVSVEKSSNVASDQNSAAQVSLNEASVEDIETVKGISKKLAQNIVAARPFGSLEDLLNVKGMGMKLLEKIRTFISL
jgi:competence ComEA-like helix-hairpin-helix protein